MEQRSVSGVSRKQRANGIFISGTERQCGINYLS
jgi:hypothetical protein